TFQPPGDPPANQRSSSHPETLQPTQRPSSQPRDLPATRRPSSMQHPLLLILTGTLASSLLLASLCAASGDWCYPSQFSCDHQCNTPESWNHAGSSCAGRAQSPVNVVTRKTVVDRDLSPFQFNNYQQTFHSYLKNNGHSVQVPVSHVATVAGGDLETGYKAVQFHLHWGKDGGPGSEHTIDGEQYPMEKIPHTNNNVTLPPISLDQLIPNRHNLTNYYRYKGSLTTPGCHESLQAFSKLHFHNGKPMVANFRPTQPLNGRVVYRSAAGAAVASAALMVACRRAGPPDPEQLKEQEQEEERAVSHSSTTSSSTTSHSFTTSPSTREACMSLLTVD
ncbi:LOW QUALITY PROTEIN: hypothetical protein CRUP_001265, partial [Coryphaenoides rupestris]